MNDDRFATAFSGAAQEYERGRPGYPAEAIDALAGELGLGDGSVVVDLAAGTGKLSRSLVGRVGEVIAIEPLAEMRAQLERQVPEAKAFDGTAEHIPLGNSSADAVLVAQAFHWFDGRRALDEIARVVRPGGGLGLLWNTTPWENRETPWFALLDDLLERRRVDLATLRRHASGFASRSYVAVLDPEEREALLAEVGRLLERSDAPVDDGQVLVPMRTAAFWTRLTVAS